MAGSKSRSTRRIVQARSSTSLLLRQQPAPETAVIAILQPAGYVLDLIDSGEVTIDALRPKSDLIGQARRLQNQIDKLSRLA